MGRIEILDKISRGPHIVDSFFKGIDKIRAIYNEYKDADIQIPH